MPERVCKNAAFEGLTLSYDTVYDKEVVEVYQAIRQAPLFQLCAEGPQRTIINFYVKSGDTKYSDCLVYPLKTPGKVATAFIVGTVI